VASAIWLRPADLPYYFTRVARQDWLEVACLLKYRSQHHEGIKMREVYAHLLECWCELVSEAEAKT
jgi:hypothetical protein